MVSSKRVQWLCFFFSLIVLAGCAELALPDERSLLFPSFQRSEVIGIVAGFGTTFAALPDLIAMLKRRSSKGMNPRMAAIMGLFQIVWVYYGSVDRFKARDCVEYHRGAVQFPHGGRVFLLCSQRENGPAGSKEVTDQDPMPPTRKPQFLCCRNIHT